MKMLKKDKDFIAYILSKGSLNYEDKKTIYDMYRKYVDPSHTAPFIDSSCSSCMSIQMMWSKVRNFASNN
jgi:hypothetical protein